MNRTFAKLYTFLLVLCWLPSSLMAYVVKGHVISGEDNEPMIGVTVLQEGTGNGVTTDIDGQFALNIAGNEPVRLLFSFVSMKSQIHEVSAQHNLLHIVMEPDQQLLEETVVVAYGTRKKGTIAGSVSTVKAEKIETVPTAGFDQALQGQAAGLTVLSNSGEPSKAATFQIRGTNSINSGTSPLFILDGIPVNASDFNTINPADIESVSVLKDASSTSIYGARAANGVVVITTKRGKVADKAKIQLRTQQGWSSLARNEWNLMNTAERIQYEKEIGLDAGQDYTRLSQTNVNWLDLVFRDKAQLQGYDLSVSQATEKWTCYVAANYFNQDGIAQSSMFRRYNLRANVESQANNWLRIGSNTMLAYEEVEQADDGAYALYTPISASRFMLPYWNPYKKDGSIATEGSGAWKGTGQNPIEWMSNNPMQMKKYKALTSLFAEVSPIEGLKFRSQFSVDFTHSLTDMKSFPSYATNNGNGAAGGATSDVMGLTITNTAQYSFKVAYDHDVNLLLGQEGVTNHSEGFQVITRGQNNDALTDISSGTRASSWGNTSSAYGYLSFFGRGEYNYGNRYYADFSLRTDASSRFGKSGRWGTFWSVGAMWNLRQEQWMKPYSWIDYLRLAASTGTSGNSSIPNYDHLALVSGGAIYDGTSGIYPAQKGNPNLGWEKLWSSNLALHFGFLKRVNLDAELYYKRTSDMLMYVPVSYAVNAEGFTWDNVGAMVNKGAEVTINMTLLNRNEFVWGINANVSYNHNEITELYNGLDEFEMSTTGTKLVKGHPVGEFYIVRYAGVNPANGEQLWLDKEGNLTNQYSDDNKVLVGKTYMAPWQGGFGSTLSWSGWQMSVCFAWVANRYMVNNDRYFEESNGLYAAYNQSRRLLYDRWKQPGDVTDIPRHGETPQLDSRFLEDASFLRLKNLSLSYSLPRNLLVKTRFFEGVRLYGQAQNLFTWTRFSGLDPESSSNVYKAQYPATRQYSFGAEITF